MSASLFRKKLRHFGVELPKVDEPEQIACLNAIEKIGRFQLPADFREFYLEVDGSGPYCVMNDFLKVVQTPILPLADVIFKMLEFDEEYCHQQYAESRFAYEGPLLGEKLDERVTMRRPWCPGWLILALPRDFILDMSPGRDGVAGQVIHPPVNGVVPLVVHQSFTAFLDWVNDSLDSVEFATAPQYIHPMEISAVITNSRAKLPGRVAEVLARRCVQLSTYFRNCPDRYGIEPEPNSPDFAIPLSAYCERMELAARKIEGKWCT